MAFGAADLPGMLADMGVPVIVAGTTTTGLLDLADEEILPGDQTSSTQIGRRTVVTVQTGTLPGLVRGVAITVDGVSYKVISVKAIDDGQVTHILVGKA